MRKFINFILMSIGLLLVLSGCQSSKPNEDLFHYKGSYVGDNSAVGNILQQLRSGEEVERFELITKSEPYGVVITYSDYAEMSEKSVKQTVLYNATFLFALIQNVDWITFNFGDDYQYKVEKQAVQKWYGMELGGYTSEDELQELMQQFLEDEDKINQFFVLVE